MARNSDEPSSVASDDQLVCRRPGAVDIVGGDQDLGGCAQDAGAIDRLVRLGKPSAQLRGGDVDAALRKAKQGHTWLRLASERIGAFIRLLGHREFAT